MLKNFIPPALLCQSKTNKKFTKHFRIYFSKKKVKKMDSIGVRTGRENFRLIVLPHTPFFVSLTDFVFFLLCCKLGLLMRIFAKEKINGIFSTVTHFDFCLSYHAAMRYENTEKLEKGYSNLNSLRFSREPPFGPSKMQMLLFVYSIALTSHIL